MAELAIREMNPPGLIRASIELVLTFDADGPAELGERVLGIVSGLRDAGFGLIAKKSVAVVVNGRMGALDIETGAFTFADEESEASS